MPHEPDISADLQQRLDELTASGYETVGPVPAEDDSSPRHNHGGGWSFSLVAPPEHGERLSWSGTGASAGDAVVSALHRFDSDDSVPAKAPDGDGA